MHICWGVEKNALLQTEIFWGIHKTPDVFMHEFIWVGIDLEHQWSVKTWSKSVTKRHGSSSTRDRTPHIPGPVRYKPHPNSVFGRLLHICFFTYCKHRELATSSGCICWIAMSGEAQIHLSVVATDWLTDTQTFQGKERRQNCNTSLFLPAANHVDWLFFLSFWVLSV